MDLSPHFSYNEFTRSDAAIRRGIENIPGPAEVNAMVRLCERIMEPLRSALGKRIFISSGYRCPEVNAIIGGSPSSQHMLGEAADFDVEGMAPVEVVDFILHMQPRLMFDQAILEFNQWVHISYGHRMRYQALVALKNDAGETEYRSYS